MEKKFTNYKTKGIDSLTFIIPAMHYQILDWSKFKNNYRETNDMRYGYKVENSLDKEFLGKGLNEVNIVNKNGINGVQIYLSISISSKILGKDYFKLITPLTINTIKEELVNRLSGIVAFDELTIWEKAIVTKCDVTIDLITKYEPERYIRALNKLHKSNNITYAFTAYKSESIIIKTKQKVAPLRFTIYNKNKEMERKENEYLLECIDASELNQNRLRFEINLKSSATINKLYFKREKQQITVGELIFIDSTLIEDRFKDIYFYEPIYSHKELSVFSDYPKSMKFNEVIKDLGYKALVTRLNYDLALGEMFIKERINGKVNLYRTKMQKYAKEALYRNEQAKHSSTIFDLLDEIKFKLEGTYSPTHPYYYDLEDYVSV